MLQLAKWYFFFYSILGLKLKQEGQERFTVTQLRALSQLPAKLGITVSKEKLPLYNDEEPDDEDSTLSISFYITSYTVKTVDLSNMFCGVYTTDIIICPLT